MNIFMIMEIFHSFWELSSVVLLANVKLNINLISDSSHWCHLLVPQSYPIPTFITSLYLLESFVNLIKTLRIFLLYFILLYKDETSLEKKKKLAFISTVPSNYSSYILSYCSLSFWPLPVYQPSKKLLSAITGTVNIIRSRKMKPLFMD